jgi:hypothetical protein
MLSCPLNIASQQKLQLLPLLLQSLEDDNHRILSQYMPTLVQISQAFVFGGYGHEVSDAGSIGRWQFASGDWVRIRVLDFVAALFALADYVCDAAEYAFAFLGAAFVAVEDVGAEAELEATGSWFVRFVVFR